MKVDIKEVGIGFIYPVGLQNSSSKIYIIYNMNSSWSHVDQNM